MPRAADIEKKSILAALTLAAKRPWSGMTLRDISDAAGFSLAELYPVLSSKTAVLEAFMRYVDLEMLKGLEEFDPEQTVRDRLFDVIMQRFDVLGPHRDGVHSICQTLLSDPFVLLALRSSVLRSMSAIIEGAGIDSSGLCGKFHLRLAAFVWMSAFRVWLKDDLSDLAKTMAHLDRQLRRFEELAMGFGSPAGQPSFASAGKS